MLTAINMTGKHTIAITVAVLMIVESYLDDRVRSTINFSSSCVSFVMISILLVLAMMA